MMRLLLKAICLLLAAGCVADAAVYMQVDLSDVTEEITRLSNPISKNAAPVEINLSDMLQSLRQKRQQQKPQDGNAADAAALVVEGGGAVEGETASGTSATVAPAAADDDTVTRTFTISLEDLSMMTGKLTSSDEAAVLEASMRTIRQLLREASSEAGDSSSLSSSAAPESSESASSSPPPPALPSTPPPLRRLFRRACA